MEYLFSVWGKLEKSLRDKYIFLFLDYDGTLVPIANRPQDARLSPKVKELLKELSNSPRLKLAVISGRGLKDLKSKLGLKNIIYAANHGLELESPKIKFRVPLPGGYRAIIRSIKSGLSRKLSGIKGVILEDKGLSLGVHYRMVKKTGIPLVRAVFQESTALYLAQKKIKVAGGKMLLEIKPPKEWDKGKMVLWLLARQRFALRGADVLPVYLGDDVTDEDAFCALKGRGITVFVGKPSLSPANYRLKDTREVFRFLCRLLELKDDRACLI